MIIIDMYGRIFQQNTLISLRLDTVMIPDFCYNTTMGKILDQYMFKDFL